MPRKRNWGIFVAIFLLAIGVFLPRCALAVPAAPGLHDVSQPDGKKIKLRLKGDEHRHWLEDENDYTVVRDHNKKYVYAGRDSAGKLVPTNSIVGRDDPGRAGLRKRLRPARGVRRDSSPSYTESPTGGSVSSTSILNLPGQPLTVKQLVIPVNFTDMAFDYTAAEFDDLFNQVGYSYDGAVGSVKDYYHEVSYDNLTVDSTVVEPVTVNKNYAFYGTNDVNGYDRRPREMVIEALAALEARGFDFSTVDGDGDGWVDSLCIVHAGGGEEFSGNDPDYIWSHRWALLSAKYYDGVWMQDYCTVPARRGWDSTPSTQGICRIGVICHEMGHVLDLPDLYDRDGNSKGIGNFGLMASGSWNGNYGTSPAHFCAWSKVTLGWVTPTVISSDGSYPISEVEDLPQVYKMQGGFSSNEYFLIENRQGVGFDSGLPGPLRGVLIWHIDDNKSDNDDQTHYMVDLEEASGPQHLELNQNSGQDSDYFRAGNAEDFSATTNPDNLSYGGTPLGIDIDYIGPTGSEMVILIGQNPPVAFDANIQVRKNTFELISLSASDDGIGDPPGVLSYVITSLLLNGTLTDPGVGVIGAVPYSLADNGNEVLYEPFTDFAGQDFFNFQAYDGLDYSNEATVDVNVLDWAEVVIGEETDTWGLPLLTGSHDARTQAIYLAEEIQAGGDITSLSLDVNTLPSQVLNNWTIRIKHTGPAEYSAASLDDTGWTVVYQNNETIDTVGWKTFNFSTPFEYNGSDNLMIDFSFDNGSYSQDSFCYCSVPGGLRSAYAYSNSADGAPVEWFGGTLPDVFLDPNVPNIKIEILEPAVVSPSVPIILGPGDGSVVTDVSTVLSWTGSSGPICPTTYDVYFGTGNPPTTLLCADTNETTCDPTLRCFQTYYWQVVAKNCAGSVPGPVWSFSIPFQEADFTGNCIVDFRDLQLIIVFWLGDFGYADVAPPGGDGIVNFRDLNFVAEHWFETMIE